ncbi:MAG TPA: pseudaminic acid cytidylyltransferase [Burkholderiales bacterium]|nr:pseudaminic acid cytidylyltransferase [Burkholderiales bacterium]
MRVAVIPARGGSKRIPRKNIRSFCGKPMIAWSLEVAGNSGLFDRIVVSTDDPEIADVARNYGAEVPFMRPPELADDHAGITEVICHATQWMSDRGWPLSLVCCIQATAPFLLAGDIASGLQGIQTGQWKFSFAATEFGAPIFRAFKRHGDGGVEMFFPEHFSTRSQDLPVALHDAGLFYWGRPSAWLEGIRIFAPTSLPILLPRWRVQDIDTEADWLRAELLAPAIRGRRAEGAQAPT